MEVCSKLEFWELVEERVHLEDLERVGGLKEQREQGWRNGKKNREATNLPAM